ncbi:MAG TPA: GNAT family N-acetyltransferase [Solirubrobacteraceae bacterium]|nr:GNAT family N-acetyltransferase [Solirubrobacteraceae bacterium]
MTLYAFRDATPADAERMAGVTAEGFETYRAFAPEGWTPPSTSDEAGQLLCMLGEDHVWYRIAEHEGRLVGHVGFLPADHTFAPAGDPRLAHFRQLFVTRAHWGSGLATRLHAAAIAEAGARGFTGMRLFTPARQERARQFYEREGWALARPPAFEPRIGLEIAEYRRAL